VLVASCSLGGPPSSFLSSSAEGIWPRCPISAPTSPRSCSRTSGGAGSGSGLSRLQRSARRLGVSFFFLAGVWPLLFASHLQCVLQFLIETSCQSNIVLMNSLPLRVMSCTIHLLSFPSILTLHGAHLSGYMNVLVLALSTNARIPGFASLT
jgi:hypothetical protein